MKDKKKIGLILIVVLIVGVVGMVIFKNVSYAASYASQIPNTRTENTTTVYKDFGDLQEITDQNGNVGALDAEYSNSIFFKAFNTDNSNADKYIFILGKSSSSIITEADNDVVSFRLRKETDYLTLLFKDSAVDTEGNLMDIVVKLDNVKLYGNTTSNGYKICHPDPENSQHNSEIRLRVYKTYRFFPSSVHQGDEITSNVAAVVQSENNRTIINKGDPVLFGLGTACGEVNYTMTYYRAGTVNPVNGLSDLKASNVATNVKKINTFMYDFDIPASIHTDRPFVEMFDGEEGILPLNGKSTIYYNQQGKTNGNRNNVILQEQDNIGISIKEHNASPAFTAGDDRNIDVPWYQDSMFMTTEDVNGELNFRYGGTGCGIMFGFFSPYRYKIPAPEKVVLNKKELYRVGETFTYRISQYVPNNYWSGKLGYHNIYSNIPETTQYSSFVIRDTFENHLTPGAVSSIKVYTESGEDVTRKFTVNVSGQNLTVTANPTELTKSEFYAHYYNVDVPVTIKTTGVNVKTIVNRATRQFNTDPNPVPTPDVPINIYYKLIVKHLEEGTNRTLAPQTEEDKYSGDSYTTTQSSDVLASGYEYVRVDGDTPSGTIVDHDIEVIYYYKKATSLLKTDSTNNKHVPNAELTVYDSTNKVVARWNTTNDKQSCDLSVAGNSDGCEVITAIEANKTYTVKETKTPRGYATSPDYIFSVDANKNLKDKDGNSIDSINIKNIPIIVCIQVVDTNDVNIVGMGVEMRTKNGTKYQTFTSENGETCYTYVPVDEYELEETKVIGEYEKAENEDAKVIDTPEVQHFKLINPLKVPKTSLDTSKVLMIVAVVFAAFGIGAFGIVKYRNKKSN